VKSSRWWVKSNTYHQICRWPPATPFQLHQQHMFDTHDMEAQESLHPSSECANCLVSKLTFCVSQLACRWSGMPACWPWTQKVHVLWYWHQRTSVGRAALLPWRVWYWIRNNVTCPLVGINALYFFQCFNAVGWVTRRRSSLQTLCAAYPTKVLF